MLLASVKVLQQELGEASLRASLEAAETASSIEAAIRIPQR